MPSRKESQYRVRIALEFEDKDSVERAMEVAKSVLEEHSQGCVDFEGGAICLSCIDIPYRALMVVRFKPNEEEKRLLITLTSPEPMFIYHYIENLKEAIDKLYESLNEPIMPVKMNIDILPS